MPPKTPRFIYPLRCALAGERLSGQFPLKQLPRIIALSDRADGAVDFTIQFGINETRLSYAEVQIQTGLWLLCERCLAHFPLPIVHASQLGLVTTFQQARQLERVYEPWILEEERADLLILIEEELLLCVPLVPKHASAGCLPHASLP